MLSHDWNQWSSCLLQNSTINSKLIRWVRTAVCTSFHRCPSLPARASYLINNSLTPSRISVFLFSRKYPLPFDHHMHNVSNHYLESIHTTESCEMLKEFPYKQSEWNVKSTVSIFGLYFMKASQNWHCWDTSSTIFLKYPHTSLGIKRWICLSATALRSCKRERR